MNDCVMRGSYNLMQVVCFYFISRYGQQEEEHQQFSAGRSLRCFLLFTWGAVVVTRSKQDRPPEEMDTS